MSKNAGFKTKTFTPSIKKETSIKSPSLQIKAWRTPVELTKHLCNNATEIEKRAHAVQTHLKKH